MVSNTQSGVAPQSMQTMGTPATTTGNGYVPFEEGFNGTRAISGAQGAGASSNGFMSSLWDFVKPDTAASRLLWGQTIQGAANGLMQGRQAQEERDYRAARSAVPRNIPRYEAIPGHAAWALNGGK